MKILFILQYIPYPLNSGGNQAMFNMINCIRQEHKTSILVSAHNEKEEKALNQLREIWSDVDFYPYIATSTIQKDKEDVPDSMSYKVYDYLRRSLERKVNRRKRKYNSRKPKQPQDFVRLNSCLNKDFHSSYLTEEFMQFIYKTSRLGFDAIQVEFFESLELIYLLPVDVKRIYLQHEIRFVRNQNEMNLFNTNTLSDILQFHMVKDQELKALSHFDKIIALTDIDKQQMLREDPSLDIYVSPAMVTPPSDDISIHSHISNDLVFIGSGDHFPNADGVHWFCSEVMPRLKEMGFSSTLYIVGVWNDEIKQRIMGLSNQVHFTGFIDNLPKFINNKISIVPIRIGSGMRMKLLDSVFACSPIVTTSKGCEGLPFEHEKNCLIADDAESFAKSIINLTQKEQLKQELARQARIGFNNALNTEELLDRRLEFYRQLEQEMKGQG